MDTIKHTQFNNVLPNDNYKKEIDVFVVYIYIFSFIIMYLWIPNEHLLTVIFYSVIILASVMFGGLAQNSKTSFFFNTYMCLSFLTLFFIYGFRDFSAIDDGAYISIFYSVSEIGWINQFLNSTMEPGYLILNQLVGSFTDNYLYMQLITAFIPLFLFYYGFKKYRHMISIPTALFFLSTMLYFQMLSVALVRMFIGISIVFVALYYIPKRKPVRYITLIVLASLFHYSAFFMVTLSYFAINKTNLSKKAVRAYIALFSTSPIVFILIARYIIPLLGNRYSGYGSIENISFSVSTFTTIPILLLMLLFHREFYGNKKLYFKLFLWVYALSIIISIFGGMINLGRLIFYSYTAFILAASMISKLLIKDSRKLLYAGVIIPYGVLYLWYTQFINDAHIPYFIPYENIFFTI